MIVIDVLYFVNVRNLSYCVIFAFFYNLRIFFELEVHIVLYHSSDKDVLMHNIKFLNAASRSNPVDIFFVVKLIFSGQLRVSSIIIPSNDVDGIIFL